MEMQETGKDGSRILLVPGGPGLVSEFYTELVSTLSRDNRVITFEPSGTWPEDPQGFPRTMDAAIEELAAAVKHASMKTREPVVLLGHSFGAALVLGLLSSERELPSVTSAIVVSGFHSGEMLTRGIANRAASLPADFHTAYNARNRDDPSMLFALLKEYWFPRHFCRTGWPESFNTGLSRLNAAFSEHYLGPNLLEPTGVLNSWSISNQLHKVDKPTLVAGGLHDYFLLSDVREMAESIPDGHLWMGEESSHSPWIEQAKPFFHGIRQFIQQ
jgi:proline-specific peptidase